MSFFFIIYDESKLFPTAFLWSRSCWLHPKESFNMFLCPIYVLKLSSWIYTLDQIQVQFLWQKCLRRCYYSTNKKYIMLDYLSFSDVNNCSYLVFISSNSLVVAKWHYSIIPFSFVSQYTSIKVSFLSPRI